VQGLRRMEAEYAGKDVKHLTLMVAKR